MSDQEPAPITIDARDETGMPIPAEIISTEQADREVGHKPIKEATPPPGPDRAN